MKKYLSDYIAFIEKALADNSLSREELERIFAEMPMQIGFMQHERLIHLIVTVLFALLLFIAMAAAAVCFSTLAMIKCLWRMPQGTGQYLCICEK